MRYRPAVPNSNVNRRREDNRAVMAQRARNERGGHSSAINSGSNPGLKYTSIRSLDQRLHQRRQGLSALRQRKTRDRLSIAVLDATSPCW